MYSCLFYKTVGNGFMQIGLISSKMIFFAKQKKLILEKVKQKIRSLYIWFSILKDMYRTRCQVLSKKGGVDVEQTYGPHGLTGPLGPAHLPALLVFVLFYFKTCFSLC